MGAAGSAAPRSWPARSGTGLERACITLPHAPGQNCLRAGRGAGSAQACGRVCGGGGGAPPAGRAGATVGGPAPPPRRGLCRRLCRGAAPGAAAVHHRRLKRGGQGRPAGSPPGGGVGRAQLLARRQPGRRRLVLHLQGHLAQGPGPAQRLLAAHTHRGPVALAPGGRVCPYRMGHHHWHHRHQGVHHRQRRELGPRGPGRQPAARVEPAQPHQQRHHWWVGVCGLWGCVVCVWRGGSSQGALRCVCPLARAAGGSTLLPPPISPPPDDEGHGTHIAGIIGAVGNNGVGLAGINWRVSLLSCKFLDQ